MRINQVYIQKLENLLAKGFKEVGKSGNGLSKLIHPKTGKEVVLGEDLKLLLGDSAKTVLQKRNEAAQALTVIQKQAKTKSDILKKSKKISNYIFDDAQKRDIGALDFSPESWFSFARNIKQPRSAIDYYTQKFLPQIKETYTKLVKEKKLYKDPTSNQVMGIIDGQATPLKRTKDVMSYIVVNTPNAKHLHFDGTAYVTGVPAPYVNSFIRNGGATNKPTWGSSNLAAQGYYQNYQGPGGIGGVFTSYRPELISEYLTLGSKTKVPNQVITLTPTGINPTSNNFIGSTPIDKVAATEPYGYQVTSRAIRDDIASTKTNSEIQSKMQVIGSGLPLKSILGNSGEYNMKSKNPFNIFVPAILTGGLAYEAQRTTGKERN